jgi:protein-L-isoaspartate(D-aspartate) O-methyltransferase
MEKSSFEDEAPISVDNDGLVERIARAAPSYLDGGSRSQRVLEAMLLVDRADFLPPDQRYRAYDDAALPIGLGQTCSQSSMVAFMLDKLELRPGLRVLEIGAGSGYAACVAARLCLPGGLIVACEIVPGLARRCRASLAVRAPSVTVIEADGSRGLADLEPDGILLYPEARGDLRSVTKLAAGGWERSIWHGVSFVPLVGGT